MAQLIDYETNATIREATAAEARESANAAVRDGGAGVIRVNGRRCYVPEQAKPDDTSEPMLDEGLDALINEVHALMLQGKPLDAGEAWVALCSCRARIQIQKKLLARQRDRIAEFLG